MSQTNTEKGSFTWGTCCYLGYPTRNKSLQKLHTVACIGWVQLIACKGLLLTARSLSFLPFANVSFQHHPDTLQRKDRLLLSFFRGRVCRGCTSSLQRYQEQGGASLNLLGIDVTRDLQTSFLHNLPCHSAITLTCGFLDHPVGAEPSSLVVGVAFRWLDHIDLVLWQVLAFDGDLVLPNIAHIQLMQSAHGNKHQIPFLEGLSSKYTAMVGHQDFRLCHPGLRGMGSMANFGFR